MNDLPGQANGYGLPGSDHASSRTEPDNAERLNGATGSALELCDRGPPVVAKPRHRDA
jgi:hypothetical protein